MNAALSIQDSPKRWDAVVLIHGLFATKRSMSKAHTKLEAHGYLPISFSYSSCFRKLESHLMQLLPLLRRLDTDANIRSINFLAHSCGGILMRYALQREIFSKLRRAVMLAPPNAGTPLAKYSVGAFDRLFPAVRQLADAPEALPNQLSAPQNIEVGVIAAETDMIVGRDSTHLPNQSDHCVMPTSHFELPRHKATLDRCLSFLAEGRFQPNPAVACEPSVVKCVA